jgi:hypothetical protein
MEGDGRVCFCRLCSLNVYDFSEMTRAEVEALVFKTEGRLCGRLTRRADGTVLTKDCPVGLRALRLRTTRAAGAAFAALLGLFAAVSGRPAPRQAGSCPSGGARFKVERKTQSGSYSTVSGTVYDERCALIYGAAVSLKSKETGRKFETKSSDDGEFLFAAVPSGTYTIEITSPGFIVFHRDDFHVGGSEAARVGVVLEVGMMGEIITVEEPKTRPAIESRPGSTVIRDKMLTDLPLPPGEEK